MKSLFLSTAFGLLTLVTPVSVKGQTILPQPSSIQLEKGRFAIAKTMVGTTNLTGEDYQQLQSYMAETFGWNLKSSKKIANKVPLQLICTGTKEQALCASDSSQLQAYTLTVTPKNIIIKALTPMGLFYGLQSLRQLRQNESLPCLTIEDSPRFSYRGLMIDCSRHFWTKEVIKRQLDAMAYFKLDRFHWHLVDGGGWRMEVKKYPRLTSETAYRTQSDWNHWWNEKDRRYCPLGTEGAYGGFYTQEDIKEIVKYAKARHITVIPEIEMPGHSDEVVFAYPEISCTGKPYTQSDLCVGKEATYSFMENVLKEVMNLFPSEYIHIGGDEAERTTWKNCPDCQKVMQENNLKDVAELQSHFTHRIEKFLNDHGRKLLGWDEIMEGKLAPNATVMSWRGTEAGLTAAKSGHHVVMTPQEYCYLNMYQDVPMSEPKAQGGYMPLQKTYDYEPIPEKDRGTEVEKNVLGVQGCVWTEFIATPEHLEYMMYPRLLALAEKGWTHEPVGYDNFKVRALVALDELKKMGYNTFNLAKEKGAREESRNITQHGALGKSITYLGKYAEKYRAEGDNSLVNGLRGNWGYLEGKWQGFIDSTGVDVVIDMGQLVDIRDVEADFMHQREAVIYAPSKVELMVSDDGNSYRTINTVDPGIKTAEDYMIYPYRWNGNVKGRYVRLKAKSRDKDAWLFVDEVIVNKK